MGVGPASCRQSQRCSLDDVVDAIIGEEDISQYNEDLPFAITSPRALYDHEMQQRMAWVKIAAAMDNGDSPVKGMTMEVQEQAPAIATGASSPISEVHSRSIFSAPAKEEQVPTIVSPQSLVPPPVLPGKSQTGGEEGALNKAEGQEIESKTVASDGSTGSRAKCEIKGPKLGSEQAPGESNHATSTGSAPSGKKARSAAPPPIEPASGPTRTKKKNEGRSQPRQKVRAGAAEADRREASCPSSQNAADIERDLKLFKKKAPDLAAVNSVFNSPASAGERDLKRNMMISYFREQYAKIGNIDVTKQYSKVENASTGLSIKDGHRPMPRPSEVVDLPADHKKPVGNISHEELQKYNCDNKRMLMCVHGDLFDVSDRPDKYGRDGPYWAMAGHDISWGLVCGNDDAENYDKFFDIFKILPDEMAERKLMGLMSWWCFYEKEYGEPVGRLDLYNEEWKLPTPPEVGDVCSVM